MHIPLPTLFLTLLPTILALPVEPASPIDPRSSTGSWFFRITKTYAANGYRSQIVFANYTSDSYPAGLVSNCRYVHDPTPKPPVDIANCDRKEFSWSYDNTVVKLQQVLDKPIAMTVFGDAPLTLTSDAAGRSATGSTTVVVTSAIA